MKLPEIINWLDDALVVDFETIGANPATARIIELSILGHNGKCYSTLVNPGIEVPFETTKITNITQTDIEDAPKSEEVIPYLAKKLSGKYFVAHNGQKFDNVVAQHECARFGIPWTPGPMIDTLKLAQRAWYTAQSHTVGALMEMLQIEHDKEELHGAKVDTICTLHILVEIIKKEGFQSIGDILNFQSSKRKFGPCITFGKHSGTPWENVPKGYLHFLLGLADMDPDIKEKIQSVLMRSPSKSLSGRR